jgi:NAD(P)-dependent dehydrogenase (short-subunit alcohol dehydrogenase family)
MVHSAGRAELMPVRRNDISLMKADMTLNYFSFVELCKYFYSKRYSREGSSIIALSSLSARTCYAGALNYTASKASVNVAVKTIAKEFLKRKIRVNAILPANVNTSLTQNEMSFVREDNSDQSMGFVAVETVAQMIEFLLSDKAAYVTGAEIPISAGMII